MGHGASAEYGRPGMHMLPVSFVLPSQPQKVKFIGSFWQLVDAQRPVAPRHPEVRYSQKSDADAQSAVFTHVEPSAARG